MNNLLANIGKNRNHKKGLIALLGLCFLLVILLAGAYLLRNTLGKIILEHITQEQQLQVNCLDLDFDWQANIQVNKLCIELPNLLLNLDNATWLRSANSVMISSVYLQHVDKPLAPVEPSTSPALTDFQLPANLPTVSIEKLRLISPLLAKEIQVAVSLDNAATLVLSGDITANIRLQNKIWQAEIEWTLADVIKTLPLAQTFQQQHIDWLTDDIADNAKFVSRIDFDGRQLRAKHDVNVDVRLVLPNCSTHLQMQGSFDTSLPELLVTPYVNIDLSAMHNTIDLSACEALPKPLADLQLQRFDFSVPKPVYLDFQHLTFPELQLTSHMLEKQLLLHDIRYTFKGVIELAYNLSIKQQLSVFEFSSGKLELNSTGQLHAILPENLPLSALQWTLSDGLSHLSVHQLSKDNISLTQLTADIKLSGSQATGIQLSADLQADTVIGFELALTKLHSRLDMSINPENKLQIRLDNMVQQPSYKLFKAAQLDNHISFSAMLSATPFDDGIDSFSQVNLHVDSVLSKLHSNDVQVVKLNNQIQVLGDNVDDLQFILGTQLDAIQLEGIKLSKVNNQLNTKLLKRNSAEFSGQTKATNLVIEMADKPLLLKTLSFEHQGKTGFTLDNSFSHHKILLENSLKAEVEQQQQHLSLLVEQQNVTDLQPLIRQLSPDLTLTQGKLNARVVTTLNSQNSELDVAADVKLDDVSGRYAEYLFSGLSSQSPISISSAGLQLGASTLRLNLLNVGLPIEHITATLLTQNTALKLENINGNTLGGQFRLKDVWLDGREQHFDVVLENIDLAQIVALQDQPGISITGHIGGKLPVSSNKQALGIEEGKVVSQGGGVLTIKGNPAFDSIKQQQGELGFLENYHFSQLASKVTLKPDGWLYLDLAFYGQNPDKKQAVNFNYTHQENLFTLLKTLRVTNNIQDKIEQNISKGAKQ